MRADSDQVAAVLAKPIAAQLLREAAVLRVAYTALDGSPRCIPASFGWDGSAFTVWTLPHSAKVKALRHDPRVALTVDVVGPPTRLLLARGRAQLTDEAGVPDGYLQAMHRVLPAEAWDGFDARVTAIYPGMVAITVVPDWAKLIDFETTSPSAVEALRGPSAG